MASLLSQTTVTAFSNLSLSCKNTSTGNACKSTTVSIHSNFGSRASGALSLSSSSSFSGQSLIPVVSRRPLVRQSQVLTIVAAEKGDKTKKVAKKLPTVEKRAKQAEVKRIYHKSRKSEMATRMKKAFLALEALKNSSSPAPEQLVPVEKLISEAYQIIDKSVKVGTIHPNKGARRKSRLARAKRAVSVALGWYVPTEAEVAVSA